MRIEHSDPDIEALARRIDTGELDLQPDFQRGEVWSIQKKRRLIDSILRGWHIPAIHDVANKSRDCDEVLDGQQRLASIRDFLNGNLDIDGTIEPVIPIIQQLHKKRIIDLPSDIKKQINRYTIRIFRLADYEADEPAELFYRLNQPANLAPAEQRNAFYGPVRDQIRQLAQIFFREGMPDDLLEFSNARMAYDDIIAKLCFYLEAGSLGSRASAQILASRYRSNKPYAEDIIQKVHIASTLLIDAQLESLKRIKFNKATLLTWLCFLVDANTHIEQVPSHKELSLFLSSFQEARLQADAVSSNFFNLPSQATATLFFLYTDRSTSRVSDVLSVLLRDFVVWCAFKGTRESVCGDKWKPKSKKGKLIVSSCDSMRESPDKVIRIALEIVNSQLNAGIV